MSNKKDIFKYYRLTMDYANSKIWYLLLVALVPSVLVAFIFSPYGAVEFLCRYSEMRTLDFLQMYMMVSGINIKLVWLGIVGIFVVPLFLSILFGAVERHMRVGEFNLGFDRVRSRLNFNYSAALKFTAVIFVIYQVGKLFQVMMFYLLARTLAVGWGFALSLIWYIIVFIFVLGIFASIVLWVPTMLQTGLNSAKALGQAVRQGARYGFGTMVCLMVPTLPMIVLMIVNCLLHLKLDVVLDAVLLTITSVYFVVLMYTMFFDINGVEREDLKKVDIWKKPKKRKGN